MTKRIALMTVALVMVLSGVAGCSIHKGQGKATYTCYYSDGSTSTTTRVGNGTIGPECK